MTTIAEFLERTSGNQFPTELYKEAWSVLDWGKKKIKQVKNTAKAVGSAAATVGSALSGAASTAMNTLEDSAAINDINKAPTEANVRNFLNKHITWDTLQPHINPLLEKPQFKPYAPIFTTAIKDPNVQQSMVTATQNALYNAYVPKDPKTGKPVAWTPDAGQAFTAAMQNAATNKAFPADIQTQMQNANMQVVIPSIISNDDLLYQVLYTSTPENSPQRLALDRTIGANPERRAAIAQEARGTVQEAYNGYTDPTQPTYNPAFFADTTARNSLQESLAPKITGKVQDYGIEDTDIYPDDPERPWEDVALANGQFGDDSAYRNIYQPYYKGDNYTKSNNVLFGIINTLLDDDLGLKSVDYYSSLPEEERANSTLHRAIAGMADLSWRYGLDDQAADLQNLLETLSSQVGTKGSRFATNEAIYAALKEKVAKAKADLDEAMKNSSAYNAANGIDPLASLPDEYKARIQADAQNLRDTPWDDGYFGLFSDPNVRRAVQYAAPWLGYGVPLAALASMFGTNSLWPLVLLGGLGSGVFGYGAQPWFGMDDETMQGIDQFFGTINSPMGSLAGTILPENVGKDFNNLLNGSSTASGDEDTGIEDEDIELPSMPPIEEGAYYSPGDFNIIDVPAFSSSGNAYASNADYDRDSTSYTTRNYNPMKVRSLRIG